MIDCVKTTLAIHDISPDGTNKKHACEPAVYIWLFGKLSFCHLTFGRLFQRHFLQWARVGILKNYFELFW
jgi:hypothetical protein